MSNLNPENAAAPAPSSSSAANVLIAEDDPVSRRVLERWLQKWNYRVVSVGSGVDAWNVLQKSDSPQMAILDWEMPGLDGVEVCRRIRSHQQGPYKYVVLLTAKGGKEDIVSGLEAGADDYLTKPFDADELRARIRAGRRILELQDALLKAQTELQFEASHDRLTGMWNRGAILDLLVRETQRTLRLGGPIGVIMADLDHFKQINDSHGHLTGDAVLCEVANRLAGSVRNYDYVGRYGGEEFLVVLSECTPADLMATAERMRFSVAEKPIKTDSGPIPVTLSVGLAAQILSPDHPKVDLVQAADAALYRAKANGRNRVECAAETFVDSVL